MTISLTSCRDNDEDDYEQEYRYDEVEDIVVEEDTLSDSLPEEESDESDFKENGDGICECTYTYDGYEISHSLTDEELSNTVYKDCEGYYNALLDMMSGYGVVTCK